MNCQFLTPLAGRKRVLLWVSTPPFPNWLPSKQRVTGSVAILGKKALLPKAPNGNSGPNTGTGGDQGMSRVRLPTHVIRVLQKRQTRSACGANSFVSPSPNLLIQN